MADKLQIKLAQDVLKEFIQNKIIRLEVEESFYQDQALACVDEMPESFIFFSGMVSLIQDELMEYRNLLQQILN